MVPTMYVANEPGMPDALFGREREVRVIEELLDSTSERGSVLLIRGDAGIGKSSILRAAKSLAVARGMSVLSATGVQTETNLPFTGLDELLRPVLVRADHLPGPQQNALRAAFGLADASAADLFLVALGALDLLSEFASEHPLLLLVDDAQWLDQSSTNALAFIARRLQSEPIVLLIASRDTPDEIFADIVPELHVAALDDAAARSLLQARNPSLPTTIRDRVLSESDGNPLALVELPKAITSEISADGLLPAHLPLTTRLERAFAAQISDLPLTTRQLLLVAAVDDGSGLAEILSATKVLSSKDVTLDVITPAVSAGLIHADTVNVQFRHPLVRSAIHGGASIAERVAAQNALAAVLKNDPDRRVWHQAAATVGADEAVAEDLESAANRALQRGDVRGSIQLLERASQLSVDTARRTRCLLQAAELAFDIGLPTLVVNLLQKAETLELSAHDRIRLTWLREAAARTVSGTRALAEIADNIKSDEDVDLALDLLSGPATKGWWTEPDEEVCNHVIAAVEAVRAASQDDPRFLLIVSMTAPIERGAFVIDGLHRLLSNFGADARIAQMLGLAASQVGDFEIAERFLTSAVATLRSDGRLALLAHALVLRAWSALYLGNRNVAIADAEEGERLALETDQPIYLALARAGSAMLAARRGDQEAAERFALDSERVTQPLGTVLAEVFMARGMSALAAGRYDDAYRHYIRMFDRSDVAYHPMRHCFVIGDLAEAAAQSDHRDVANAKLIELEQLLKLTPSPQFHRSMYYARAVLADDADAERLFTSALAADVVVRSPFTQARFRLALGAWLRRARRLKESRTMLQLAMEAFDSLGGAPWSERARQELRATGLSIQRRDPDRREQLTPQELQIALMAAEGLSNRDIGQKLYLSHRTVGSHLYRIFPKLDITSRYQLREALAGETPAST